MSFCESRMAHEVLMDKGGALLYNPNDFSVDLEGWLWPD